MGRIYIFSALVIATDIESHFSQLLVFAYAIFLFALWASTAFGAGAGLGPIAYLINALEVVLAANMALLLRSSRISRLS